jgi:hypothetical protein
MGALPGLFESGAIDLSVIAGERKKANQCCKLSLKTFGRILFLRQYYFTLFLGYFNLENWG